MTPVRHELGKRAGWLAALALCLAFPAVGMFVLPAALLWVLGGFGTLDRFTRAIYCVFFGISCWTWLPWLTRYIPVSFSSLIWIVVLALAGILVFVGVRGKGQPRQPTRRLGKGTCLLLVAITAVLVLARLLPTVVPNVPPGADMSMHVYYARMVIDSGAIPRTHRPLLPIDSFGEYPIGFSLLVAATSAASGMTVQDSSLLLTGLTYVLLALGLFALLRVWFGPGVSLAAACIATFLGHDPQNYCEWGGNPTVLSFAFVLAALGLQFSTKNAKGPVNITALASLWAAALLVHSIPVLGTAYYLIGFVASFLTFRLLKRRFEGLKEYAKRWGLVFLCSIALVGPFLAGFSPELSEREIAWTMWWQRAPDHAWHGAIADSIVTIPRYIHLKFGYHLLALAGLGFLVSTLTWRTRLQVVLSSLLLMGLVVNSQYWVLPFSYGLYPERMAMLLLAPLSVLCAGLIDRATHFASQVRVVIRKLNDTGSGAWVSKAIPAACASLVAAIVLARIASVLLDLPVLAGIRFRHVLPVVLALLVLEVWTSRHDRKLATASVVSSVFLIAACLVAGFCWNSYWQYYGRILADEGSVSQFDMKAFEWIKQNTLATDIIQNLPEYDESGLWIPALCGRRILRPHSNPFYNDELIRGNEGATPTYAFVGSKPHGSDRLDPTLETIRHAPQWQKVASFGRAEVYKRRLMGPGVAPLGPIGPRAQP